MRFRDYLSLAFRSLRRSRLRSGLTIAALLVGATGITIMLTFVTSVKNYVVNQFVQTGQVRQIAVSQDPNLTYDPSGGFGGQGIQAASGSATSPMSPALEAKITAIPHVQAVSATFNTGGGHGDVEFVALAGKKLQPNFYGYQPDGVIEPPLLAGRDLGPADTSGVILVSQDYADAFGFKGAYARIVGQTVEMRTRAGYTGAGASLPDILPPQNACSPNQRGPAVCGPMSGLPAVVLRARIVGVVNTENFQRQTMFIPLSWLLAITRQAQPKDVRYPQQNSPPPCQPGTPCPQPSCPQGQQCNGGGGGGGPGCSPGKPCAPQGPGTVVGGWTRPSVAQVVADRGGFTSMVVKVDAIENVAGVARAIDGFGVSAATGLAALEKQKRGANVAGLVLGALGLIALGIAALGVMNTMVMSVLERTREIGVMRALGARRSTIRRLFTFEAAALGFLGGLFGVILGYIFVLVAKPIITKIVKSSNATVPNFSVPIWLVVLVVAGTTVIGLLSGFLPARRAARLDPVEALRYE